eukprot:Selendium_serpulae@DN6483_c0_g2_i3.p1
MRRGGASLALLFLVSAVTASAGTASSPQSSRRKLPGESFPDPSPVVQNSGTCKKSFGRLDGLPNVCTKRPPLIDLSSYLNGPTPDDDYESGQIETLSDTSCDGPVKKADFEAVVDDGVVHWTVTPAEGQSIYAM